MTSGMDPKYTHRVTLHRDDWLDIQQWCWEQFGEFDDRWYKLGIDPASSFFSQGTETVWYFTQEEDAVLFTLRWA